MNEENKDLESMYGEIRVLIENCRKRIYSTVNTELLNLYWSIGKRINEMQGGEKRAKYASNMLEQLSNKLTSEFGKGFSERNLERMRVFYLYYSISTTLSPKLTWSHYIELIKIKDKNERDFYMIECINSSWDVRTLRRQKKSLLYERIMLNSNDNKREILPVKGNEIINGKDLVKNPYILEFLDLKENMYSESELEKSIINHLKEFMLELGRGFSFIGSQVRIKCNGEDFYIDLVFYNIELKCYVLIDLKVGRIIHRDIGQMEMYVNYYNREVKNDGDSNTVGILLGTTKNMTSVKYLISDEKNIFASIYKLHFPSEEELREIIEEEKRIFIKM